jgi:SAM-dependent methyltransferase
MDDELRSTERFSDRVEDYVRYRPSYPVEVIRTLERKASVAPDRTRVVDLGCGTGISAACFLREGYTVTGVEPNADMRAAAETTLGGSPRFRIVAGRAEDVPLPDSCCELIVAAQAFHWFDAPAARSEMRRLLVDDGVLALLWNERRTDASAFLRAYDSILRRYATDYARVAQTYRSDADIAGFFGPAGCARRVFPFHQDFDLAALTGRAMSSSYVPKPGQSGHDGLVRALTEAFERHSVGHMVRFEYDTRLYFGRLS